ncbi:hypothetical protein KKB69_00815, partial [Patescibacteria group bacterium]|nr:hypothetical protein [Patescibacteria group bacterium]
DPQFPKESDYHIIEDCGLVKPLTIDGKAIDLSVEPYMDKAPMNPPNRACARKRLCDLAAKIGIESIISFGWSFCRISTKKYEDTDIPLLKELMKNVSFHQGVDAENFFCGFPFGKIFHFYHPQKDFYPEVDEFIEWVKGFVDLGGRLL